NIGFVVGGRCVAVIDTGGSPAVGRALRRAVRAVTERPICYVINTHVHPDHILGNLAFEGDDPDYVGHHRLPEAIAARGEYYRTSVARALGRELPDGVLVAPDRVVEDERVLDLGGRELRLQALPPAHTDNDLLVEDSATGTLWASDLVFVDRAPSLDGSLKGWLAVLDRLMGMPAARAVPGHGPPSVSWPAGAEPLHGYLETLLRRTRRALEEGATMEEAVERVGRVGRGDWRLLEHTHRRNVMAAYAELEWE
ncbi:MAG: quinoprotein relay system zinc metallohydrolase 2, partial [Gammaproteobacteria bacterium]|nr:quinoprotein relay system zinc metallohydrolase 2 [Gammaproteobacteria bacterium]